MGFRWYTDEQRLRINLSRKAYQTMQEDMALFHEKERSTFINRVFRNFYEQARASSALYLSQKKQEFSRLLSEIPCDEITKSSIIDSFIKQEKERLLQDLKKQEHNKSISKTYRINNENQEILNSDECLEDTFYDTRIGLYLKCVIEEYTELPYFQRERVYFREFYDLVETAIQTERLLKMTLPNGVKYYVYPYKLAEDALSSRTYLTGYLVLSSDPDKNKKIASMRLPRVKNIQILKQSGHLTKKNISDLENAIENRSVQFLLGEEEEIHVYLTDAGIERYYTKMSLRPLRIEEKSTEHEFVFYCTPLQAEYFFFQFGAEAKILKPDYLRQKFSAMYEAAAKAYQF